jgi:segregation and condensation protein A
MQETNSQYNIKAGTFDGPLDLLLSLIEQRKLFVNEISLSEVTNDYIAYIKSLPSDTTSNKNISDVSYFILVAATLILIKSRSLLPNLELTQEEESKIVNLESRLKLYQIIKNASLEIKNIFGLKIIFTPIERNWSEPIFAPDTSITVETVSSLIGNVLNNLPKKTEKTPEVQIKRIINIDEFINNLHERIQNAINISFKDFAKSHNSSDMAESKVNTIVSFLAMLELVREGIIDVIQNNSFDDIQMSKLQNQEEDNLNLE